MRGIADFDVCFPSGKVSAKDMQLTSGVPVAEIKKITHADWWPALADGEMSWELALRAARKVLTRTGVAPGTIQQVIFAGSGEWDIPFWSPAAKVAHALGIDAAHCFEVVNFCNAGMTALQLATSALEPGRHALVLVADRLSRMVDHGDPGSKSLFNFGDSAAAVLVSGDGCAFELLHSAMRTDPSWSDYYTGRFGKAGITIRRAPHRRGLADAYVENFTRLVADTLTAIGRSMADVAHFLINHGDKDMHQRLLRTLGIPETRSVFNYHRLGHMGGADTLIALRDLVDRGRLRTGDLILLATSAMGFSWGITALEVRV